MMAIASELLMPLVQAARRQEAPAWDRLLKEHQRAVFAYLAQSVGDEAAAMDLLQETFAAAVKHIGGLRDDRKFTSWLFGIAHQRCVAHWRSRQRDRNIFADRGPGDEEEWTGDETADPSRLLVRKEQEGQFWAALDKLPPVQRSVLVLRWLEDFPLADIAAIVGVPLGTVKSRLHHATAALREAVQPQKGK